MLGTRQAVLILKDYLEKARQGYFYDLWIHDAFIEY